MEDAIKYLTDYIALLESQRPRRESYYGNYLDKVVPMIKEQIVKLKELNKELT